MMLGRLERIEKATVSDLLGPEPVQLLQPHPQDGDGGGINRLTDLAGARDGPDGMKRTVSAGAGRYLFAPRTGGVGVKDAIPALGVDSRKAGVR